MVESWGRWLELSFARQLLIVRLCCFGYENLETASRRGWRRFARDLKRMLPTLWRRWCAQRGGSPGQPVARSAGGQPSATEGLPPGFFWRHVWAAARYKPKPYDGPVTVFLTDETSALRPDLGRQWRCWASAVREIPIPGNHSSIMRKYRAAVAARLQQCCAEAESGGADAAQAR